jgi:hypothetical protein
MTDSRVAPGLDRLPWLPDEPARPAKRPGLMIAWAIAAIILVAAVAYWLGVHSETPQQFDVPSQPQTVTLPEAAPPASPPAEVRPVPAPEVERVVAPPIPVIEEPVPAPVARSTSPRRVKTNSVPVKRKIEASPAPEVEVHRASPAAAKPQPLRPWPVRELDGASGRLVRVGTFSTVRQAKKGWWAIVRMNPALKHLPALVVPVQSQRNGRVYYRLQMGTTSQAHSTVLCQRMRMIGQGCVVIGLNSAGQEIAM